MKKLGLIGGIGPASTLIYYSGIIDGCRRINGAGAYPSFLIDNINMTEMLSFIDNQDEASLLTMLINSVLGLKAAGAELIAIASNTPHIVCDELALRSPVPVVSIVEAAADYAEKHGYTNVLLLGTLFTMSSRFYPDALARRGIICSVPKKDDAEIVHNIIFPKLEEGVIDKTDKSMLLTLIDYYIETEHIDAVILGCTELPIMINQKDLSLPVIDTTAVHIAAIVNEMCS